MVFNTLDNLDKAKWMAHMRYFTGAPAKTEAKSKSDKIYACICFKSFIDNVN